LRFAGSKDRLKTSAHDIYRQQQRLCLARGLLLNPNYLADEPCSALDPISSE